jgi:hypothetical protein
MKQSILLLWLSLSLSISGFGQQNKVNDTEIPILTVDTDKWPIKLTKQPFEGDTIYNLTFRDAGHTYTGKISTQGFFIFELKAFGDALQTALRIDSGYEVHFKDGTIEKTGSKSNYGHILIRFATGTGSFITTAANAVKLIYAIKKEGRMRSKT